MHKSSWPLRSLWMTRVQQAWGSASKETGPRRTTKTWASSSNPLLMEVLLARQVTTPSLGHFLDGFHSWVFMGCNIQVCAKTVWPSSCSRRCEWHKILFSGEKYLAIFCYLFEKWEINSCLLALVPCSGFTFSLSPSLPKSHIIPGVFPVFVLYCILL